MALARLDNEVYFKKAFTDPFVFRAFVKDILGIEVDPPTIETEKAFAPRVGSVAFKYDIFAEDPKSRTIIEIQKVEYDHNFDRFLHYHLSGITEQQRSSGDYSVGRTVYTIVVMTAPYRFDAQKGMVVQDEVLVSSLNPRNLVGAEREIFGHKLVFLNPNYKGPDTPANYRDWLDLIYESIHHAEQPNINTKNPGVMRAAELVNQDNITPEERAEAKFEVSHQTVLTLVKDEGRAEGAEEKMMEMVVALKKAGVAEEVIATAASVGVERVRQILSENR